ncbi:MAG: cytochrome c oxidase accessory protein CcoG [bacterium]
MDSKGNDAQQTDDPVKFKDPAQEETIRVLDLYQTQEKIQVRRLEGFFRDLKRITWAPMMLAYFGLPWINWDGRQIVWFDLPARQFHVFGMTFWPQDFMLLAWLLIISAFALFTVTVLVGRVWCGFSCPQTVWTMWFMLWEHLAEGDRNARIKLDKAPWSWDKIRRRSTKHIGWVLIAFLTAVTFVGYFNPIRELVPGLFSFSAHPAAFFWVFFFTAMTYMNAGFLREQVCPYMCPYARFQSVMFDQDTLIVSYDPHRGEPRGARKKGADHSAEGKGDCVDCSLCVQVCPTGIDIRDGLQYECISCGLCVDACNAVMDKMNYPRGLISFTTEHAMEHGKTSILRPRFVGYLVALSLIVSAFSYVLLSRVPLEVDVIRDRNLLFRESSRGLVENVYTLKILNMDTRDHRYRVSVDGDYDYGYLGETEFFVAEGEVLSSIIRLELDPGLMRNPNADVMFHVESLDNPAVGETEESRFIGPRLR